MKNVQKNEKRERVKNNSHASKTVHNISYNIKFINGAADKRFSLIGDAPAVEFEENIFHIHAYGILFKDKARLLGYEKYPKKIRK